LIYVAEFDLQPIICKKDYLEFLKRGKIYYRPKHKTESTDNFSHHDMRELIYFATEKYHLMQSKLCEKFKDLESNDEEMKKTREFFNKEAEGF